MKTTKTFGFEKFSRDRERKHLPDMSQFTIYISFLFNPWHQQEIDSTQSLRENEQQLQGTGERPKHGIVGISHKFTFILGTENSQRLFLSKIIPHKLLFWAT